MSIFCSLIFAGLLAFFPSCTPLSCRVCRHMGDFSLTPPDTPNSRIVFNRRFINCTEEDVECDEDEDLCLMGYARTDDDTFWVQKGCVRSSRSKAMGRLRLRQSVGCLTEWITSSQIRNLPIRVPGRPIQMNMCVCNTADRCNAGDGLMTATGASGAGRTLVQLNTIACSLLAVLSLSLSVL